jgi:hypothetical protein
MVFYSVGFFDYVRNSKFGSVLKSIAANFLNSTWINTSLCHSVLGVTRQSVVHTTVGATDQLKRGSRCQSRSNRLKDLGRIAVDGLELSQERIGAVPLSLLELQVCYQLSGMLPRSETVLCSRLNSQAS